MTLATAERCIHHYILDMPNGPQARGVCKHCGTVRYFSNVLDHALKEAPGHGRNYSHVAGKDMLDEIREQYLSQRIAD